MPLVSADYRGETRSAVIEAGSTMVIDGTQIKVLAWYDNETGYAYRMLDLLEKVGSTLAANPTELATEMSVS